MPRSVLGRLRRTDGSFWLAAGEAGFQPFDRAVPFVGVSFVEPGMQVGDDLLEPVLLSGIGPEHGTAAPAALESPPLPTIGSWT